MDSKKERDMDEYNRLLIEEKIDKPRASPERIRILCLRRMEANKVKYHPDPECTFKPDISPVRPRRTTRNNKESKSALNSPMKTIVYQNVE